MSSENKNPLLRLSRINQESFLRDYAPHARADTRCPRADRPACAVARARGRAEIWSNRVTYGQIWSRSQRGGRAPQPPSAAGAGRRAPTPAAREARAPRWPRPRAHGLPGQAPFEPFDRPAGSRGDAMAPAAPRALTCNGSSGAARPHMSACMYRWSHCIT